MLRLAFDFIITWRETRTRPNAYLPFTILTNALTGGHMGTYLGLFNGTICVPQIVAASLGGIVLKMFTSPGSVAPEVNMLILAGVFLIIGAGCVSIIKER